MSRTERLFQIVQILRSRPVTTAAYLAERLNVSERTIYRYINDLSLSGIPVISETGTGYWLDEQFELPPLMFNADELIALSLGAKLVQQCADPFLADAAQAVLEKIEQSVPDHMGHLLGQMQLHAPFATVSDEVKLALGEIRGHISQSNKISFDYLDLKQQASTRVVWPLAVAYWGKHWSLAAWCEHRQAFRAFRIERMENLQATGDQFPQQQGRTFDDYVAFQQQQQQSVS